MLWDTIQQMSREHIKFVGRAIKFSMQTPDKAKDVILARRLNTVYAKDVSINGVDICIFLPDMVSGNMYLRNTYEPEVTSFMESCLNESDTFWDIGPHIGYHSLQAKRIAGTNSKVLAFEPTPRT